MLGLSSEAVFAGQARPSADNAYSLGTAPYRWSTVYAATGTINTSDAREKTPLRPLSPGEVRAVRRVMAGVGVFQRLSAIDAKGADPEQGGARLHVGVTAQAVHDAFAAEGLDARCYALFCEDAGPDGVRRFGVRYDQLLIMAMGAQAMG